MKSQFKKNPIALAMAAMLLSPIAFANGYNDHVTINKDVSLDQNVQIDGHVSVDGDIYVDASSVAIVDDKQINGGNDVTNNEVTNSATVGGAALNGATGNIGVNVTSGDNNQQANAAAFSAADASFVFGSSDAEVFATQAVFGNQTSYVGNTNNASLSGDALANASGNIGVNISAGNNNQQKNDLAASVAVARIATATVQANQLNGGNTTTSNPIHREEVQQVGVNLAFSATGTYSGQSDQIGNVYPDIWGNNPGDGHNVHPTDVPGPISHLDLDTQTQGGSDLNNDGGALAFNEAGTQALSGSVTGNIPVVVAVNLNTTNTASLGDNALRNASGNIGVNIASGTNNQQFNGLAISATQAGARNGGE